jgi:tetratricopeptide (TPR) repeat protein
LKTFLVLFLLVAFAHADYREQFDGQLDQRDFPGMEKTLADWKRSSPGDMEWRVASGSYFYQKGLAAGDRRFLFQALAHWQAALQSDPWRLDVGFALARLYQDLGEFESQYGLLAQTLQSADNGWRNLRWAGGQKLPKRSSKLIPETLAGYTAYYFGLHTREGDEEALRLARLSATFYPYRPSAYASMATYFSRQEDWPHTLKYLLIASQKDPKDSLVLCNIGDTLRKCGKKKAGRIYYQRVVALNNDPEMVEKAGRELGTKNGK